MVQRWIRTGVAAVLGGISLVLACTALVLISPARQPAVHAAPGELRVCNTPGFSGYSTTLQSAVDAAQPGDVIKVAGGVYTESKLVSGFLYNLYITKTVHIFGGYTCDNWATQNYTTNVTIVRPATPDISVVSISGPFGQGTSLTPTLDGLTITGGGGGNHGGGLRIRDSDALVSNNVITGNVGFLLGGGVWVQRGAPRIENNRIENNRSDGFGQWAQGGGIQLEDTQATLIGNLIASNVVSGTSAYGGGVDIAGGGPVTLTSNTILSNAMLVAATGEGYGGGLAVSASALTVQGGSIINNDAGISGPAGGIGGGLYSNLSRITLDAVQIQDNIAGGIGDGGGLVFVNSPYTLTNVIVAGNRSPSVGGIQARANSPGLVVNTDVISNTGQGIQTDSPLTLTNSIVMSHTTGISLTATASLSATFNAFWANDTHVFGGSLDATNLITDPQLSPDYHLTSGSPLIDAGTRTNAPDHDLDAQPRPMAGPSGLFKVDIGADERPGLAQRVLDLDTQPAGLTVIGPGNPPENPNSNGPNDWIGYAVLGDDVNGDSRPDLVTAAEDWAEDFDNPPFATGRLFGLLNTGARITGTVDFLTDTADLTVVSRHLLQHVGSDLVGGDLNADGRRDLVFGSFQDDNAGNGAVTPTVFALWGGPSLAMTRTLTDTTPADFMLRAPDQNFFSFSARNALATGRLNADNVDDLIVGDGLADDGGLADAGAVFVIFGNNALGGLHELSTTPADYTLYGPAANAGLWYAAVGRVNADAQADLVARTDTTAYVILGPLSSSSQHLSTTSANITITGLQFGGLIVTDLTGDGQDDVVLGSGDKLYVLAGPLADGQTYDVTSTVVLTLTGASAESLAVGDVDGDSRPDLIVGAPGIKRAFVVPGGVSATGTVPIVDIATTVVQSASLNKLGFDVAAGDLDADGRPDLIVGTYGVDVDTHPNNFKDAGTVYVFYSECPTARYNFNESPQVDIGDVQTVAGRWHDPGQYDIRYDVAPAVPDGVINIRDIMTVVTHLGEGCS